MIQISVVVPCGADERLLQTRANHSTCIMHCRIKRKRRQVFEFNTKIELQRACRSTCITRSHGGLFDDVPRKFGLGCMITCHMAYLIVIELKVHVISIKHERHKISCSSSLSLSKLCTNCEGGSRLSDGLIDAKVSAAGICMVHFNKVQILVVSQANQSPMELWMIYLQDDEE